MGLIRVFCCLGFFLLCILNVCKIFFMVKGVLDINFGICLKFYMMFMVVGCKKKSKSFIV